MPYGFWDIYEFKKFKGSYELHRYLKEIYAVIKKYDQKTPIMCHAGICSAFQTHIGDVCDDYEILADARGGFEAELAEFVDCVLGKKTITATAEDGLICMKILDAIYEAARTGHEVVIK